MSKTVKIGNIKIGGGNKIAIQSMCSTKASDITSTVAQINKLASIGCDIMRVAVPDMNSAKAIKEIKKEITIPLVADIHFDHKLALEAIASGIDKLRINPGNIGSSENVRKVAESAKAAGIPIRIGVNGGSIDRKKYGMPSANALVLSAMDEISILEKIGFYDSVISLKTSDVTTMIDAYTLASQKCDYPLHLGVTEAGLEYEGIIKNAVGIGSLLSRGIGDTIRVSLTADVTKEVRAAKEILAALDLYKKPYNIISCPTCGRTEIDIIAITNKVKNELESLPAKKPMTVAVMGCAVNGPGEASLADVGIAGGKGCGLIFRHGEIIRKVNEKELVAELINEIKRLNT